MSTSLPAAFVGLALASTAFAICQYPDGSDVSGMGYVPCAGEISSCCIQHPGGAQDTCLSNGLCYSEIRHYVYQGACNDEWGSDRCPKYCLNDYTTSFERLFHCEENDYCCSKEDCCNKPEEVFDIGTPCVEEYLSVDNATSPSNTTSTATTTPTKAAERSPSCTPWPHAYLPPNSDPDKAGGTSMARNLIIFSVLGCLCVLLVVLATIFCVRRNGAGVVRRGSKESRARRIHASIRDFGKRVMGHQHAFTPIPAKPYQSYQGYQPEKLRGSFSSASDSGASSTTSSTGSGSERLSPGLEMEPMLTPEPVKTRQYV